MAAIGFEHSDIVFQTTSNGLFCGNRDLYEVELGRHLDMWIEGTYSVSIIRYVAIVKSFF
jgi:hypothetical protein